MKAKWEVGATKLISCTTEGPRHNAACVCACVCVTGKQQNTDAFSHFTYTLTSSSLLSPE